MLSFANVSIVSRHLADIFHLMLLLYSTGPIHVGGALHSFLTNVIFTACSRATKQRSSPIAEILRSRTKKGTQSTQSVSLPNTQKPQSSNPICSETAWDEHDIEDRLHSILEQVCSPQFRSIFLGMSDPSVAMATYRHRGDRDVNLMQVINRVGQKEKKKGKKGDNIESLNI